MNSHSVFLFFGIVAALASQALAGERITTLRDQRSVNVTIYNDGNALVHDRRSVALQAGLNRIAWRDVSASLDPTSAILDAPGSRDAISVLEQNFNYDVLNGQSLLHAYLGHWVTVVHPPRFKGEKTWRERAKILSLDNGIVLQYADRIETRLDGYIDFPAVPKSLRDRPTLTLDVQSPSFGRRDLDLRYLTSGLTWSVDYVATLAPDRSSMRLLGLVTLQNTSGTSYDNARLQLVAGSIHTAVRPQPLKSIALVTSGTTADVYSVNGSAAQQDMFEYHLYTISHRTTILNKQTKQLALLSAARVPVRTTLELHGYSWYYYTRRPTLGDRLPVGVYVSFVNRGGELGIPLPAGIVRVYANDANGLAQYLGSDSIQHTPRDESVRLHLGDAFDVVASMRQTDFTLETKCESRGSYDVHLLNAKDAPQSVKVLELIPGDWHITKEDLPHVKTSANTASWTVPVPARGSTDLTYTADVRWCRDR